MNGLDVVLWFGALFGAAGLLVWLHERAERRDRDAADLAEEAERARRNMPAGHPERLTVLLLPTQEWDCGQWDRELDEEAAE